MRASAARASEPQSQTIPLTGGLDLVTPPVQIPPGRVIAGANYEPRAEGYRRIEGYERLDGHTAPSAASYSYMTFSTGSQALTAGTTVTGATSSATGVLLVDGVKTSGSYGSSNAFGYLVLTSVTGTFQNAENIQVSGVTKCVSTSTANDRGAQNDTDDATWLADAILGARNAIQKIPGGGPTRGAFWSQGYVWGFRDDDAVSPTKTRMYKATTSGWVLQALGYSLPFTSGGTTAIAVGDTITGATSSATGVVSRVILTGGTWAGGDAVGRFMLSTKTGTFQSENLNVGVSANLATIAGDATANIITHGGRFEFINENFYGATSQGAMYAVYGTGPGFEWDGAIFTPISTGAATETPEHIAAHKNHLFLSYPNGSLQGSQAGLPQNWNGSLGATVFGLGQDIKGLVPETAGVMAIFCRERIQILSGSSSTDFALAPFTLDAGAIEWTLQTVGVPTYVDSGGVRTLNTTQAFGDFKLGTLTQLVQPLLDAKKKAGVTPVASLRVRTKSQYRLFFSDGTGIAIFIGGKNPSILPFDFGTSLVARFTSSGLDGNEDEILLLGSDDGYVYHLDKGMSLDGGSITGFLQFPYNHSGTPNQNKRYQKVTIQADAPPAANIFVSASLSDGDPDQANIAEQDFDVAGGGGLWDVANWNQFFWSARIKGQAAAHIDGLGYNISLTVGTMAADEEPHTLHSLTLLYSPRGPLR